MESETPETMREALIGAGYRCRRFRGEKFVRWSIGNGALVGRVRCMSWLSTEMAYDELRTPPAPSAESTHRLKPRPPCAVCGINEADDCFTVCGPCWDKEHPKSSAESVITPEVKVRTTCPRGNCDGTGRVPMMRQIYPDSEPHQSGWLPCGCGLKPPIQPIITLEGVEAMRTVLAWIVDEKTTWREICRELPERAKKALAAAGLKGGG